MDIGQPFRWLPNNPYIKQGLPKKAFLGRKWHLVKIALGLLFISFFLLDYQPTLNFPPLSQNKTHAQEDETKNILQTQSISAQSLPFGFQLPHPGYLSTKFSSYHPGIDIATGLGMPIKPIAKGVVIDSGYNFWGLGLMVEIDHGQGYSSLYAHMGKTYVTKGQSVSENDLLGEVGLTGHTSGPHTHLEVTKGGVKIDPLTILPTVRDQSLASDFKAVSEPVIAKVELKQPTKKLDLSNQIRSSL